MNQTDTQASSPAPARPPFRVRYKLHGMIAAVVVMWLDAAYLYQGLIADDPGAVAAGMAVMGAAVAMAYYFS